MSSREDCGTVILFAAAILLVSTGRASAQESWRLVDWGGNLVGDEVRIRAGHLERSSQLNTADEKPEEVRGWKFDLNTPLTRQLPGYHAAPVYAGLANAVLGRGNVSAVQTWGILEDGANDALFYEAVAGKTNVLLLVWKKTDFARIRTERIGFSQDARAAVTGLVVESGISGDASVAMRWWVNNGGRYFVARQAQPLLTDGRVEVSGEELAQIEWGRHPLTHQTYNGLYIDHDVTADRQSAELNDIQAIGLLIQVDRPNRSTDIAIRRFVVTAETGSEPPGWAERLYEAGVPSGLVVHVGVGEDLTVENDLARDGRYLVHGLHPQIETVHALRRELAERGLFPAANVQWMSQPSRLPYKDGLVRTMIVDPDQLGGATPGDDEIQRTLAYGGTAWVRDGNDYRIIRKEMPDDIDDWTHAFHGPDRIPLSRDRRVRPVTGLRWQAGTDKNAPGLGLRIAGGRVFSIIRVDGGASPYSYRQTDPLLWLVARDAANGVILWRRPLGLESMPLGHHSYYRSSHHFVATTHSVYIYPDVGAPLTAFDAATGRIKRVYDQGARLGAASRAENVLAQRFSTMFVLVRDGKIIQSVGNKLWCLDERTGDVLFHDRGIEGDLTFVTWIGDRVLAVEAGSPPVALALDANNGNVLWRSKVPGAVYYQMFADEDNMLISYHTGGHPIGAEWHVAAIDPADGSVRWKRPTGCAYRGCIYAADSEVWFHDAYRGHEVMDPDTGATVRKQLYQAIGGGCGIEVMTPDWIVRGSFLVPRDDEDASYVLSAVRPNCEIPMYPAYGSIFTTGTGCGCDWYLEGSAFALHDAKPVQPLDDACRLYRPSSAPVIPGIDVQCRVSGAVPNDWTWVSDPGYVSKANRWQRYDRSDENAKLKEAYGKNIEHGKWYSLQRTAPVTAGDLTLVSRVPDQMLEAKRDGKIVWTFLAGARITVAPRVDGDLAYVGCNDGWVYALRVADGSISWQRCVAPEHRLMTAFGAVESTWPVFGVLLHEGVLYYQAGRSTAVDEGLWAGALDPKTGEVRWTGRSVAFPAKMTGQQMNDHGYRTFKNRSLGLNAPLKVHDGKIRYLHSHHFWDPDNPQNFLNDEEQWIYATQEGR